MKKTMFLALATSGLLARGAAGQVTYERLRQAAREPHNWLTYSGSYSGARHSSLDQLNAGNVRHLAIQWIYQIGTTGQFETTPLAIDGVLYLTGKNNFAAALDARTGRPIWTYQHRLPEKLVLCCGPVNRGMAALGDRVFMATLDAHVVALDAKTGNLVWDVVAEDYKKGYSFTLAPLAVKDKIIVGVAGGEYGVRGFIEAYEAETGKRAWRFYTIPGPGEPGHQSWEGDSWKTGGAPGWVTGSYDPDLNLIYWGTGNPGPDLYGDEREGDNLYSDSLLALDADSGKLKWHYQFTPHDVHDWDSTEVPVLLDLDWGGKPRKLVALANRNGFFYVLDRASGELLLAKPFARVTWAKEIGPNGRPVVLPGTDPTPEGNYVCPGLTGATNWMSPAYNAATGLFYVVAREQCDKFFSSPQTYREGHEFFGSAFQSVPGDKGWGAVRAIDPKTGKSSWEFKYFNPPMAGALSTAGGLVFAGNDEGYLVALEARSGKPLWHLQTGAAIVSAPMTYALQGRQYVVIPAGSALFAVGLPDAFLIQEASGRR